MTAITAIATYRPAWHDPERRPAAGHDEDEVTMAVAAALPLVASGGTVERVMVVSREPARLDGDSAAVVAHALGIPSVAVNEVLGGGPAVLDLVAASLPGTVIIGVGTEAPAGAAAVLAGTTGVEVKVAGGLAGGLPIRVRRPGDDTASVYDDPRLLREESWRPIVEALTNGLTSKALAVSGVPTSLVPEPHRASLVTHEPATGSADVLMALAAVLATGASGRVVTVEQATGRALDVASCGTATVTAHRSARRRHPLPAGVFDSSVDVPISLAAYARAFPFKVGLLGGRCRCGELSFPPRRVCLRCGEEDGWQAEPLARRGEIYSVVTVRTPVPGLRTPYSLAVVSLDESDLRVLAPVADTAAGTAAIGDRGELVLRLIAVRQAVPDYGYAFRVDGSEADA